MLPYILEFIAGAKRTGALAAIITVVRRSSAMPDATFPMIFAVAGATTIRSAFSARSMCDIFDSCVRSNISCVTGYLAIV